MAHADCFVLSSDYEGQPMVILEAMVLGLPIVTTDFASVRGALPDGYGRIVPMSVDGVAEGMRAFLAGQIRTAFDGTAFDGTTFDGTAFDGRAWNESAVQQFYDAIGATTIVHI
jgi:glycosyltransferase involved in cell wall biosynthesis